MGNPLHVLFLAAEAEPFVKIGGLGDVAGALPPALLSLPEPPDIRLVIPYHKQIRGKKLAVELVSVLEIGHASGAIQADVFMTKLDKLTVYLIDGKPFREASLVYTSDTLADGHKFTFFSLAALELCRIIIQGTSSRGVAGGSRAIKPFPLNSSIARRWAPRSMPGK